VLHENSGKRFAVLYKNFPFADRNKPSNNFLLWKEILSTFTGRGYFSITFGTVWQFEKYKIYVFFKNLSDFNCPSFKSETIESKWLGEVLLSFLCFLQQISLSQIT
jgi:hypothetical protein